MTRSYVPVDAGQEGIFVDRRRGGSRTSTGWSPPLLLLLLGGVFPLIFTELDPRSLFDPPVLLALLITQWASLRIAGILVAGKPHIVRATFWIFVYIWFGLAALAQTVEQRFPIASQTFSEGHQIEALLAIIVGLAAYEIGVLAYPSVAAPKLVRWSASRQISIQRVWVIACFGAAGTLFALWSYGLRVLLSSRYTVAEAIYGRPAPGVRLDQGGNKALGLLEVTLVWAPAFLALYLLLVLDKTPETSVRPRSNRFTSSTRARMMLIGLVIANLLVNNPISSPRYRFGGVALALLAVVWPLFNPRRLRLWICGLLFGVMVAFPLLEVFRYDTRNTDIAPLKELLLTSPDFGMFQQELNAQLYVDEQGFTFGKQVLGVVLGYFPRALWPGKPIDTGNVIVRTNAINASASLWATVFLDGGLLAVAVTFLAYGWLTRIWEEQYLRRWRESSFIAAAIPLYAGFQIILLRGDLQPAVGSLAPLLVMLLFVSRRSGRPLERRAGDSTTPSDSGSAASHKSAGKPKWVAKRT